MSCCLSTIIVAILVVEFIIGCRIVPSYRRPGHGVLRFPFFFFFYFTSRFCFTGTKTSDPDFSVEQHHVASCGRGFQGKSCSKYLFERVRRHNDSMRYEGSMQRDKRMR